MDNAITGLTRFVESCSIPNNLIKEADSVTIRESMNKIPSHLLESVATTENKGWWVPISHFGNYKNGNGRIYNTKLWENVINNQRGVWLGSPMLTDHPAGDSDGNPKDICGVWLDCKLGAPNANGIGIVYGLLVPSGRNGEDLQDHLRNGLKVGTSSSGFGKLMSDGVTVDPDTYMIERLADFVLCPSQSTYFSWNESDDSIEDNTITESMNKKENYNMKETYMKDSKLTRLEEKKFRRDMESFLESADNIKDPQERLEELRDIKSYFEEGVCSDLKEKVEAKISEQEEEIKRMLKERIELRDELGVESVVDLKEKLTQVAEDVKLTEKEAKDWKEISSQLQEKLSTMSKELEDRPTFKFVDYQKKKINKLADSLNKHDAEATKVVKELAGAYKVLKESNTRNTKAIRAITTSRGKLARQVESSNALLSKQRESFENLTEKYEKLSENYKQALKEISILKELLNKNRVLFEKASQHTEKIENEVATTTKEANSLKESLNIAKKEIRTNKIKETIRNRKALTEQEEFFEGLCRTYGKEMMQYKDKIAGAVTLSEAKKYFYQNVLNNLSESQKINDMRLPESMAISNEDRADFIMNEQVQKTSAVDRLPEGWV